MAEEDITVEERPDGVYVVFEGQDVGPFESGLAALARHEQIAEVLNCYPEDVRQALLSFKPAQDGIVRVVEYAGDDAVSLVYDGRWITGYFKPYEAEQAELFFAERLRNELLSGQKLTNALIRMFKARWDSGEIGEDHIQALRRAAIRLLAKIIDRAKAEEEEKPSLEELLFEAWGEYEPSEEHLKEAEEVLEKGDVDAWVQEQLGKCIYGLERERMRLFLAMQSRLMASDGMRINISVLGPSDEGKSYLTTTILHTLPARTVLDATRLTPAAAERLGSVEGKVIYIAERKGAQQARWALNLMVSEGKLKLVFVDRNTNEVRVAECRGKPVLATTDEKTELPDMEQTRSDVVFLREEEEHRKGVLRFKALAKVNPLVEEQMREAKRRLRALNMLIAKDGPYLVINPFALALAEVMPVDQRLAPYRAFDRVCDYIACHAILNYRQRPHVRKDGRTIVVAMPQDIEAVLELLKNVLETSYGTVAKELREYLKVLEGTDMNNPKTTSEIADELSVSNKTAIRKLMMLVKMGFVARDKQGTSYVWWLAQGAPELCLAHLALDDVKRALTDEHLRVLEDVVARMGFSSDEVFRVIQRLKEWVCVPPVPSSLTPSEPEEDIEVAEKTQNLGTGPVSESSEPSGQKGTETSSNGVKELRTRGTETTLSASQMTDRHHGAEDLERAHEMVELIARCDIDYELPGNIHIKAYQGEYFRTYRWIADELRQRGWAVLAKEAGEEAWEKTIAILLPEAVDWVRWLLSGRTDNALDMATEDYVAGFLARKLRISDELARALIEHMVERGELVQDETGLLRLRPR